MIDFRVYRAAYYPRSSPSWSCCSRCRPPLQRSRRSWRRPSSTRTPPRRSRTRSSTTHPIRTPGSQGDAAIGDMVEHRFRAVRDGQVAEQRFAGSFDGRDVQLRNVILTLPGASPRSIVVMAARDSASGPGAASSAAATAALLELVEGASGPPGTRKRSTFVSTDGGSAGAAGARQFAAQFAQRDLIDGSWCLAARLGHPAPALAARRLGRIPERPRPRSGADRRRTSRSRPGRGRRIKGLSGSSPAGAPSGLGDQAVLIETASTPSACPRRASGRCPWPTDRPDDLSAATLGDLRASRPGPGGQRSTPRRAPGARPAAYVSLRASLVPGWALALLALTLILPAARRVDRGLACAGPRRRRRSAGRCGGPSPGACLRWPRCCSSTSSPGSGSWRSRLSRSTPAASGSARARSS